MELMYLCPVVGPVERLVEAIESFACLAVHQHGVEVRVSCLDIPELSALLVVRIDELLVEACASS